MTSTKMKTNQSTKINLIGCDTIVNSPSYEKVCVWDHKAYTPIAIGSEEIHMRKLVWRWGKGHRQCPLWRSPSCLELTKSVAVNL